MTVRLSLTGAMDASVTFLLETAHSSFSSRRTAPTSPGDGVFVGEDADNVGPALDLGNEPFDRVEVAHGPLERRCLAPVHREPIRSLHREHPSSEPAPVPIGEPLAGVLAEPARSSSFCPPPRRSGDGQLLLAASRQSLGDFPVILRNSRLKFDRVLNPLESMAVVTASPASRLSQALSIRKPLT